MRILSIDVGIKNLAYCLIDVMDDAIFQIISWEVINLCKDKVHICEEKKAGKLCKKAGKYHKNGNYYCKTHARQKAYIIPTKKLQKQKLDKTLFKDIKKICEDMKLSIPKKSTKKFCLEKIRENLAKHYFEEIIKVNSKDINLVEYGRNIKQAFNDKLFTNPSLDCVIVENQIGPLALKMKVLQGMIMQHFIEKGCPTLEQISPINKLKEFIGTKKTTYGERKKLGIIHTRITLNKNNYLNKWLEHFERHKKKDDLADAFLQVYWYLKFTGLMKI